MINFKFPYNQCFAIFFLDSDVYVLLLCLNFAEVFIPRRNQTRKALEIKILPEKYMLLDVTVIKPQLAQRIINQLISNKAGRRKYTE